MMHRTRAARVGSLVTAEYLARHIGREDGLDFCHASDARRPGERLVMKTNPFGEPILRKEWDKGFWQAVREMRGGDDD
jgi:hypothetical protein